MQIGSVSAQGAMSTLLPEALNRITEAIAARDMDSDLHAQMLRNSYVVSADMAHACHPNYEGRHDPALAPKFHGGLVIKHNVSLGQCGPYDVVWVRADGGTLTVGTAGRHLVSLDQV